MAEKAGVMRSGEEGSNQERINELRSEIHQTRADMERTINELQDRLSPANLKGEVQEKIRDATVGKAQRAGMQVIDLIRENPVPALLGGFGLGWLIVKGMQQGSEPEDVPSRYLGRETYAEGSYAADEEHKGFREQLYEKTSAVGAQARERAREYSERAGEMKEQLAGKASELGGRFRESVSEYGDRAKGTVENVRTTFSGWLSENPFGVALAVFAVGIVAGLALPVSEKERELGEQVAVRTGEAARSTMEKVKSVAEEARESSARKAKEEGLM